jgi:hypothetical protein
MRSFFNKVLKMYNHTIESNRLYPNIDDRIKNREYLFHAYKIVIDSGAIFSPISKIDSMIENFSASFFIKHDIHGMNLDRLIRFAEDEKKVGVTSTYFFMVPKHPLTVKHYGMEEQLEAMLAIKSMGHEIGIHIDPFFLIHHNKNKLEIILKDILFLFRKNGIQIECGNMHGNSSFKGLDNNGFGTSFDLFDEIARQPDFLN